MSNMESAHAAHSALEAEKQRKLRDFLIGVIDTLPRGPSDRDALAEKAMVAYLLTYGSSDYETVATYAYKMADAMIAERLKRRAETS